jgi:AraC-like DNA-binding protein
MTLMNHALQIFLAPNHRDPPQKTDAPRAGIHSRAAMTTLFRHRFAVTPATLRNGSQSHERRNATP